MKNGVAMLLGAVVGVAAGTILPKAMDYERKPTDLLDEFNDEFDDDELFDVPSEKPQDLDDNKEE